MGPRMSRADDSLEVWESFRRGPLTLPETPGVREQWHRGRTTYAVWLLRVREPAVQARAAEVARSLGDAIVPQPPDDLHVTIFVAGFVHARLHDDDDTDWPRLLGQASAVHHLFDQPLSLRVGAASSFLSAAFLEVQDRSEDASEDPSVGLTALRAALGQAAPEIRFAPYRPHVTIGRYVRATATEGLAEALRPWRELPPLDMSFTHLELATFDAHRAGAPLLVTWAVPICP